MAIHEFLSWMQFQGVRHTSHLGFSHFRNGERFGCAWWHYFTCVHCSEGDRRLFASRFWNAWWTRLQKAFAPEARRCHSSVLVVALPGKILRVCTEVLRKKPMFFCFNAKVSLPDARGARPFNSTEQNERWWICAQSSNFCYANGRRRHRAFVQDVKKCSCSYK